MNTPDRTGPTLPQAEAQERAAAFPFVYAPKNGYFPIAAPAPGRKLRVTYKVPAYHADGSDSEWYYNLGWAASAAGQRVLIQWMSYSIWPAGTGWGDMTVSESTADGAEGDFHPGEVYTLEIELRPATNLVPEDRNIYCTATYPGRAPATFNADIADGGTITTFYFGWPPNDVLLTISKRPFDNLDGSAFWNTYNSYMVTLLNVEDLPV